MTNSLSHLPLAIVAFSARSLAEATAAVTPVLPFAIDHFGDQDCQEISRFLSRIRDWGGPLSQFGDQLRQLPANAAIVLGGGLENWPECVAWLHQNFKVLGPTTDQLRQLRSPDFWQSCCENIAIQFPETRNMSAGASPPSRDRWLSKPVRGAGGLGICRAPLPAPTAAQRRYWQREIFGRSLGVHCVLTRQHSFIMGATESFAASDWPGPSEFIYRGSWGPLYLPPQHQQQILQLCECIRTRTGCLGWHQFDLIEDEQGTLWLLEINPRWTAGMEVLFLAGVNPVLFHLSAWGLEDRAIPRPPQSVATQADSLVAKAVVYVDRETQLNASSIARLHSLPRSSYADLPASDLAEHVVAPGQPLLTVRTRCESGADVDSLRVKLLCDLADLRDRALQTL